MNCKICGNKTKVKNGVPSETCSRECNKALYTQRVKKAGGRK